MSTIRWMSSDMRTSQDVCTSRASLYSNVMTYIRVVSLDAFEQVTKNGGLLCVGLHIKAVLPLCAAQIFADSTHSEPMVTHSLDFWRLVLQSDMNRWNRVSSKLMLSYAGWPGCCRPMLYIASSTTYRYVHTVDGLRLFISNSGVHWW